MPSSAVDGDTNSNIYQGSCTATAETDANPWIEVDLEKVLVVNTVKIANMATMCNGTSTSGG